MAMRKMCCWLYWDNPKPLIWLRMMYDDWWHKLFLLFIAPATFSMHVFRPD